MITVLSLSPAVDKIYFVEDFKPGGLYRVKKVVKSAGGKGVNVARVISQLGEEVASIGFKGGYTGAWIESQLAALGVYTSYIDVAGETRTNNNIIDSASGLETEVLETGPLIHRKDIDIFMSKFDKILKNTSVLVCSGGLPEGVPNDFYAVLIKMANSHGIKVILDSSNEMLKEGIKAGPYLVKPNLRELSKYIGRQLEDMNAIVHACKDVIYNYGVEMVVLSIGKDGAILVTKERVLKGSMDYIPVINTIGSGDSMVAGLAASLQRGLSPEAMLRLGIACATANTQFMEIGVIKKELVDKYMIKIKVERVNLT